MRETLKRMLPALIAVGAAAVAGACSPGSLTVRRGFETREAYRVAVLGATFDGSVSPGLSNRLGAGLFGDACASLGGTERSRWPRDAEGAFAEIRREGFTREALDRLFGLSKADGMVFMRVYNYVEKADGKGIESHARMGGGMGGMRGGAETGGGAGGDLERGGGGPHGRRHDHGDSRHTAPVLHDMNGIEVLVFDRGDEKPVAIYQSHAASPDFYDEIEKALAALRKHVLERAVCVPPAEIP